MLLLSRCDKYTSSFSQRNCGQGIVRKMKEENSRRTLQENKSRREGIRKSIIESSSWAVQAHLQKPWRQFSRILYRRHPRPSAGEHCSIIGNAAGGLYAGVAGWASPESNKTTGSVTMSCNLHFYFRQAKFLSMVTRESFPSSAIVALQEPGTEQVSFLSCNKPTHRRLYATLELHVEWNLFHFRIERGP